MRILFACTAFGSHGGIQRVNRNLVRAWTELGAKVDVIAVNDAPQAAPVGASGENPRVYGAGSKKLLWIAQVARHAFSRRYDRYVCDHINLAPSFALLLDLVAAPFTKRVLFLHGIEVWGRISGLRRLAATRYGRILSVSHYTAQNFLAQARRIPADRLAIFPNSIDRDLGAHRPANDSLHKSNRSVRLLSVSRLARSEREKGILDVLSALASVPIDLGIEYVVVGEGDDRAFLEMRATELGLAQRVRFCGALPDRGLWLEYERADVFILPSAKEGFGIVFLEAMQFGLPIIAAREKGVVDVVRDNLNGLLVPYGNITELAARIRRLAGDRQLRVQLGAAGRAMVGENGEFSIGAFRERCRLWFFDAGLSAAPASLSRLHD